MKPLPEFKSRSSDRVQRYAAQVLTDYQDPPVSHLRELVPYSDGHFRVMFDRGYFALPADQALPTKSQWNSLKKKFKRHDPLVFIFKEHGEITFGEAKETCLYLDFGFLQSTQSML